MHQPTEHCLNPKGSFSKLETEKDTFLNAKQISSLPVDCPEKSANPHVKKESREPSENECKCHDEDITGADSDDPAEPINDNHHRDVKYVSTEELKTQTSQADHKDALVAESSTSSQNVENEKQSPYVGETSIEQSSCIAFNPLVHAATSIVLCPSLLVHVVTSHAVGDCIYKGVKVENEGKMPAQEPVEHMELLPDEHGNPSQNHTTEKITGRNLFPSDPYKVLKKRDSLSPVEHFELPQGRTETLPGERKTPCENVDNTDCDIDEALGAEDSENTRPHFQPDGLHHTTRDLEKEDVTNGNPQSSSLRAVLTTTVSKYETASLHTATMQLAYIERETLIDGGTDSTCTPVICTTESVHDEGSAGPELVTGSQRKGKEQTEVSDQHCLHKYHRIAVENEDPVSAVIEQQGQSPLSPNDNTLQLNQALDQRQLQVDDSVFSSYAQLQGISSPCPSDAAQNHGEATEPQRPAQSAEVPDSQNAEEIPLPTQTSCSQPGEISSPIQTEGPTRVNQIPRLTYPAEIPSKRQFEDIQNARERQEKDEACPRTIPEHQAGRTPPPNLLPLNNLPPAPNCYPPPSILPPQNLPSPSNLHESPNHHPPPNHTRPPDFPPSPNLSSSPSLDLSLSPNRSIGDAVRLRQPRGASTTGPVPCIRSDDAVEPGCMTSSLTQVNMHLRQQIDHATHLRRIMSDDPAVVDLTGNFVDLQNSIDAPRQRGSGRQIRGAQDLRILQGTEQGGYRYEHHPTEESNLWNIVLAIYRSTAPPPGDGESCVHCEERRPDTVLLNCLHLVCVDCAFQADVCPQESCGAPVCGYIKIY